MENFELNKNQSGNISSSAPSSEISNPDTKKRNSSTVTVIVSIVIIILLIISGLIVWGSQFSNRETLEKNTATNSAGSSGAVGKSDDINSIENEANATIIDSGATLDYSFDAQ